MVYISAYWYPYLINAINYSLLKLTGQSHRRPEAQTLNSYKPSGIAKNNKSDKRKITPKKINRLKVQIAKGIVVKTHVLGGPYNGTYYSSALRF